MRKYIETVTAYWPRVTMARLLSLRAVPFRSVFGKNPALSRRASGMRAYNNTAMLVPNTNTRATYYLRCLLTEKTPHSAPCWRRVGCAARMGIAEPLAVGFVARQAATALAYTRQQLGKTDRSALFAHLKPGFRVLEIGPGEGACHRHWPPGLHYTAVDAPLTPSAGRASAPPPEPPELPVQATCESFRLLRGAWQELLPELASGRGRGSFDSVVVVMPSTIYFGPNQGLLGGAPRRSKRAPAL